MGRTKLPSAEQRAAHMRSWRNRFQALDGDADEVRFQADYIRDLITATDYPMFDLDEVVRIFLEWKNDKKENILTYRDKPHRSVMTGTLAAEHHTTWLNELDDSLERYLSTPEATEVEQIVRGRASAGGAAADATTGDRSVTKA
jgi:trimethylamine monooxygenase